jgi:hypothetical protein
MPAFYVSLDAMRVMEEISIGGTLTFEKSANRPFVEHRNGNQTDVALKTFEELVGLDGRYLEYSHDDGDYARYRLTPDGNQLMVALRDENTRDS